MAQPDQREEENDSQDNSAVDLLFGKYDHILDEEMPLVFVEDFEDPRDYPNYTKSTTVTTAINVKGSLLRIQNKDGGYSINSWKPQRPNNSVHGERVIAFDLGHMYCISTRGEEEPQISGKRLTDEEIETMLNRHNWINRQPPTNDGGIRNEDLKLLENEEQFLSDSSDEQALQLAEDGGARPESSELHQLANLDLNEPSTSDAANIRDEAENNYKSEDGAGGYQQVVKNVEVDSSEASNIRDEGKIVEDVIYDEEYLLNHESPEDQVEMDENAEDLLNEPFEQIENDVEEGEKLEVPLANDDLHEVADLEFSSSANSVSPKQFADFEEDQKDVKAMGLGDALQEMCINHGNRSSSEESAVFQGKTEVFSDADDRQSSLSGCSDEAIENKTIVEDVVEELSDNMLPEQTGIKEENFNSDADSEVDVDERVGKSMNRVSRKKDIKISDDSDSEEGSSESDSESDVDSLSGEEAEHDVEIVEELENNAAVEDSSEVLRENDAAEESSSGAANDPDQDVEELDDLVKNVEAETSKLEEIVENDAAGGDLFEENYAEEESSDTGIESDEDRTFEDDPSMEIVEDVIADLVNVVAYEHDLEESGAEETPADADESEPVQSEVLEVGYIFGELNRIAEKYTSDSESVSEDDRVSIVEHVEENVEEVLADEMNDVENQNSELGVNLENYAASGDNAELLGQKNDADEGRSDSGNDPDEAENVEEIVLGVVADLMKNVEARNAELEAEVQAESTSTNWSTIPDEPEPVRSYFLGETMAVDNLVSELKRIAGNYASDSESVEDDDQISGANQTDGSVMEEVVDMVNDEEDRSLELENGERMEGVEGALSQQLELKEDIESATIVPSEQSEIERKEDNEINELEGDSELHIDSVELEANSPNSLGEAVPIDNDVQSIVEELLDNVCYQESNREEIVVVGKDSSSKINSGELEFEDPEDLLNEDVSGDDSFDQAEAEKLLEEDDNDKSQELEGTKVDEVEEPAEAEDSRDFFDSVLSRVPEEKEGEEIEEAVQLSGNSMEEVQDIETEIVGEPGEPAGIEGLRDCLDSVSNHVPEEKEGEEIEEAEQLSENSMEEVQDIEKEIVEASKESTESDDLRGFVDSILIRIQEKEEEDAEEHSDGPEASIKTMNIDEINNVPAEKQLESSKEESEYIEQENVEASEEPAESADLRGFVDSLLSRVQEKEEDDAKEHVDANQEASEEPAELEDDEIKIASAEELLESSKKESENSLSRQECIEKDEGESEKTTELNVPETSYDIDQRPKEGTCVDVENNVFPEPDPSVPPTSLEKPIENIFDEVIFETETESTNDICQSSQEKISDYVESEDIEKEIEPQSTANGFNDRDDDIVPKVKTSGNYKLYDEDDEDPEIENDAQPISPSSDNDQSSDEDDAETEVTPQNPPESSLNETVPQMIKPMFRPRSVFLRRIPNQKNTEPEESASLITVKIGRKRHFCNDRDDETKSIDIVSKNARRNPAKASSENGNDQGQFPGINIQDHIVSQSGNGEEDAPVLPSEDDGDPRDNQHEEYQISAFDRDVVRSLIDFLVDSVEHSENLIIRENEENRQEDDGSTPPSENDSIDGSPVNDDSDTAIPISEAESIDSVENIPNEDDQMMLEDLENAPTTSSGSEWADFLEKNIMDDGDQIVVKSEVENSDDVIQSLVVELIDGLVVNEVQMEEYREVEDILTPSISSVELSDSSVGSSQNHQNHLNLEVEDNENSLIENQMEASVDQSDPEEDGVGLPVFEEVQNEQVALMDLEMYDIQEEKEQELKNLEKDADLLPADNEHEEMDLTMEEDREEEGASTSSAQLSYSASGRAENDGEGGFDYASAPPSEGELIYSIPAVRNEEPKIVLENEEDDPTASSGAEWADFLEKNIMDDGDQIVVDSVVENEGKGRSTVVQSLINELIDEIVVDEVQINSAVNPNQIVSENRGENEAQDVAIPPREDDPVFEKVQPENDEEIVKDQEQEDLEIENERLFLERQIEENERVFFERQMEALVEQLVSVNEAAVLEEIYHEEEEEELMNVEMNEVQEEEDAASNSKETRIEVLEDRENRVDDEGSVPNEQERSSDTAILTTTERLIDSIPVENQMVMGNREESEVFDEQELKNLKEDAENEKESVDIPQERQNEDMNTEARVSTFDETVPTAKEELIDSGVLGKMEDGQESMDLDAGILETQMVLENEKVARLPSTESSPPVLYESEEIEVLALDEAVHYANEELVDYPIVEGVQSGREDMDLTVDEDREEDGTQSSENHENHCCDHAPAPPNERELIDSIPAVQNEEPKIVLENGEDAPTASSSAEWADFLEKNIMDDGDQKVVEAVVEDEGKGRSTADDHSSIDELINELVMDEVQMESSMEEDREVEVSDLPTPSISSLELTLVTPSSSKYIRIEDELMVLEHGENRGDVYSPIVNAVTNGQERSSDTPIPTTTETLIDSITVENILIDGDQMVMGNREESEVSDEQELKNLEEDAADNEHEEMDLTMEEDREEEGASTSSAQLSDSASGRSESEENRCCDYDPTSPCVGKSIDSIPVENIQKEEPKIVLENEEDDPTASSGAEWADFLEKNIMDDGDHIVVEKKEVGDDEKGRSIADDVVQSLINELADGIVVEKVQMEKDREVEVSDVPTPSIPSVELSDSPVRSSRNDQNHPTSEMEEENERSFFENEIEENERAFFERQMEDVIGSAVFEEEVQYEEEEELLDPQDHGEEDSDAVVSPSGNDYQSQERQLLDPDELVQNENDDFIDSAVGEEGQYGQEELMDPEDHEEVAAPLSYESPSPVSNEQLYEENQILAHHGALRAGDEELVDSPVVMTSQNEKEELMDQEDAVIPSAKSIDDIVSAESHQYHDQEDQMVSMVYGHGEGEQSNSDDPISTSNEEDSVLVESNQDEEGHEGHEGIDSTVVMTSRIEQEELIDPEDQQEEDAAPSGNDYQVEEGQHLDPDEVVQYENDDLIDSAVGKEGQYEQEELIDPEDQEEHSPSVSYKHQYAEKQIPAYSSDEAVLDDYQSVEDNQNDEEELLDPEDHEEEDTLLPPSEAPPPVLYGNGSDEVQIHLETEQGCCGVVFENASFPISQQELDSHPIVEEVEAEEPEQMYPEEEEYYEEYGDYGNEGGEEWQYQYQYEEVGEALIDQEGYYEEDHEYEDVPSGIDGSYSPEYHHYEEEEDQMVEQYGEGEEEEEGCNSDSAIDPILVEDVQNDPDDSEDHDLVSTSNEQLIGSSVFEERQRRQEWIEQDAENDYAISTSNEEDPMVEGSIQHAEDAQLLPAGTDFIDYPVAPENDYYEEEDQMVSQYEHGGEKEGINSNSAIDPILVEDAQNDPDDSEKASYSNGELIGSSGFEESQRRPEQIEEDMERDSAISTSNDEDSDARSLVEETQNEEDPMVEGSIQHGEDQAEDATVSPSGNDFIDYLVAPENDHYEEEDQMVEQYGEGEEEEIIDPVLVENAGNDHIDYPVEPENDHYQEEEDQMVEQYGEGEEEEIIDPISVENAGNDFIDDPVESENDHYVEEDQMVEQYGEGEEEEIIDPVLVENAGNDFIDDPVESENDHYVEEDQMVEQYGEGEEEEIIDPVLVENAGNDHIDYPVEPENDHYQEEEDQMVEQYGEGEEEEIIDPISVENAGNDFIDDPVESENDHYVEEDQMVEQYGEGEEEEIIDPVLVENAGNDFIDDPVESENDHYVEEDQMVEQYGEGEEEEIIDPVLVENAGNDFIDYLVSPENYRDGEEDQMVEQYGEGEEEEEIIDPISVEDVQNDPDDSEDHDLVSYSNGELIGSSAFEEAQSSSEQIEDDTERILAPSTSNEEIQNEEVLMVFGNRGNRQMESEDPSRTADLSLVMNQNRNDEAFYEAIHTAGNEGSNNLPPLEDPAIQNELEDPVNQGEYPTGTGSMDDTTLILDEHQHEAASDEAVYTAGNEEDPAIQNTQEELIDPQDHAVVSTLSEELFGSKENRNHLDQESGDDWDGDDEDENRDREESAEDEESYHIDSPFLERDWEEDLQMVQKGEDLPVLEEYPTAGNEQEICDNEGENFEDDKLPILDKYLDDDVVEQNDLEIEGVEDAPIPSCYGTNELTNSSPVLNRCSNVEQMAPEIEGDEDAPIPSCSRSNEVTNSSSVLDDDVVEQMALEIEGVEERIEESVSDENQENLVLESPEAEKSYPIESPIVERILVDEMQMVPESIEGRCEEASTSSSGSDKQLFEDFPVMERYPKARKKRKRTCLNAGKKRKICRKKQNKQIFEDFPILDKYSYDDGEPINLKNGEDKDVPSSSSGSGESEVLDRSTTDGIEQIAPEIEGDEDAPIPNFGGNELIHSPVFDTYSAEDIEQMALEIEGIEEASGSETPPLMPQRCLDGVEAEEVGDDEPPAKKVKHEIADGEKSIIVDKPLWNHRLIKSEVMDPDYRDGEVLAIFTDVIAEDFPEYQPQSEENRAAVELVESIKEDPEEVVVKTEMEKPNLKRQADPETLPASPSKITRIDPELLKDVKNKSWRLHRM